MKRRFDEDEDQRGGGGSATRRVNEGDVTMAR